MGDPLLSPGRIFTNHFDNELLEVQRNRWSARSRLPLPKQPERIAMPADQGCGFDNQKSRSPSKEVRPENQPKPSRVRGSPWSNQAFLIERQLLTKKQILGNQSSSRTENETKQARSTARQDSKNVESLAGGAARLLRFIFRSRTVLIAENLFLRKQFTALSGTPDSTTATLERGSALVVFCVTLLPWRSVSSDIRTRNPDRLASQCVQAVLEVEVADPGRPRIPLEPPTTHCQNGS